MRCVVVYATRDQQYQWSVELPPDATVAAAIQAARELNSASNEASAAKDVPWDEAPVGVFGELRPRSDKLTDGDRIEIYRPLISDPRDRRRESVRLSHKTQRR